MATLEKIEKFKTKAIAGFSLGGLSAIDTAWSNPGIFSIVGVFSGVRRLETLKTSFIGPRND